MGHALRYFIRHALHVMIRPHLPTYPIHDFNLFYSQIDTHSRDESWEAFDAQFDEPWESFDAQFDGSWESFDAQLDTLDEMTIPKSKECVVQAVALLPIDLSLGSKSHDLSFECELLDADDTNGDPGVSFPLKLDAVQKSYLESKLNSGELISNKTTIRLEGSNIMIQNDNIIVPPGHKINFGASVINQRATTVTGIKPILVVRVTDSDGKAPAYSAAQLSDDVFGTYDDPVNLKSQMYGCSFGQLNIIPGGTFGKGNDIAAPGVIEVTIPITLTDNSRADIRKAVTAAAQTKLGFSLPGPYQHVMYSLEGCYNEDCRWAAYAFSNHWLSVYQAQYITFAAIQMHGEFSLIMNPCTILNTIHNEQFCHVSDLKGFCILALYSIKNRNSFQFVNTETHLQIPYHFVKCT